MDTKAILVILLLSAHIFPSTEATMGIGGDDCGIRLQADFSINFSGVSLTTYCSYSEELVLVDPPNVTIKPDRMTRLGLMVGRHLGEYYQTFEICAGVVRIWDRTYNSMNTLIEDRKIGLPIAFKYHPDSDVLFSELELGYEMLNNSIYGLVKLGIIFGES